MDIRAFGKGKGKQGKGTARAKAKASKESKERTDRTRTRARTRARIRLNVGIADVDTIRKNCWGKKNTKGGSKGKHKPKNADAHNLDSKPSIAEPEVEIDEVSMTHLNVDALQEFEKMRERVKIGVDTGAGKTAWPQSITYGTTMRGDSDLTFRATTGELVKVTNECKLRVVMIGDRISEFEVFKDPCANHCCLMESTQ